MDEKMIDTTAESEMTEEIVETIAQSLDADEFESRTEFAHEIIATLEAAGYAVVPVEPTEKQPTNHHNELATCRDCEKLRAEKDGAYEERNRVVALLASMCLDLGMNAGLHKTNIPGWDDEWHGCVYIDLPIGQVSWHYHDSSADLFSHLPPYNGEWDFHTTEEKYERIAKTAKKY